MLSSDEAVRSKLLDLHPHPHAHPKPNPNPNPTPSPNPTPTPSQVRTKLLDGTLTLTLTPNPNPTPHPSQVRTKLLDGTLYQDEAEALAKKEAGTSSAAVTLARYHEARGASRQRRESDERTASYKARARIIATLPADAAGLAMHAVGAVFGAASTLDVATWPAPPQLLTSAGVQLRQLTNFGGGAAAERAAAEAAAAEAEKAAAEKAAAERAALLKTRSGRRQAAREAKVAAKKEAADKQAAAAAEAVKAEAAALKVTLTLTP